MIRSQGTAFGPAKALFALTANMQSTADQPFTKLFTGNSYLITHVVARVKTGGVTVACDGGIYTKPSKGGTALVAAAQSWTNLTAAGKIVSATVAAVNNTDEQYTNPIEAGTAQAGASSTLTLAAGASAVDNFYNNFGVRLVSGAGSVQERPVTAYNGTTKVATVSPRWRTNLLTYSEQFDNAAWIKAQCAITPNAAIAPDGQLTADKVICNGTTDPKVFQNKNTGSALAGRTFTWSVWLWTDAGQPTAANLYIFDLSVGDVSQIPITLSTTPQRFSITKTFGAGEADTILVSRFDPYELSANGNYLYAWGGQLEENSSLGDYIATGASAITLPDATTVYNIEQPSVPILSLTTGSTGACTSEIFIYGVTP